MNEPLMNGPLMNVPLMNGPLIERAFDERALDQAAGPGGGRCGRDRRRGAAAEARRGAGRHRRWRPVLRTRLLPPLLLPSAGRLSRLRLGLALDAAALDALGLLGSRRLPAELLTRTAFLAGDPARQHPDLGRVERHDIGAI